MPDPLCTARHGRTLDPECRCNEYAKVRADERRRMRRIAEAGWEINGWADFQPTSTERSAAKQKAQKAAQARWQKPPLIDLRAVRDAQA